MYGHKLHINNGPLKFPLSHSRKASVSGDLNKESVRVHFLNYHFKIYSEKTIEGYLDLVPSLKLNAIKPKLITHAFQFQIYAIKLDACF